MNRIESVAGAYRGPVESVERYTLEEQKTKFAELYKAEEERAELRSYLAKNPTPPNMSFSEILQQEIENRIEEKKGPGYILDIGNHQF